MSAVECAKCFKNTNLVSFFISTTVAKIIVQLVVLLHYAPVVLRSTNMAAQTTILREYQFRFPYTVDSSLPHITK
jgi:hypothetical protein